MKTVLTIAGSDCSGGAGIQADIKTIAAQHMYAMSVITALTAQNTTGVSGVQEISPDFVAKQLDCIFTDIPPDSVKIGMLSGEGTIRAVAAKLRQYGAKNVVVDPVMVSTSGTSLLSEAGRRALWEELLPLSTLVTPNLPETQVFSGQPVETEGDMLRAAREISRRCKNPPTGVDISVTMCYNLVTFPSGRFQMSDQTAGLTYKGRPLMRKDNMIYYGSMADSHIVMLQVLDSKPVNGLNVATRVSVQLLSNDPNLRSRERIVKKSEKEGLYTALDVGCVWLERALAK